MRKIFLMLSTAVLFSSQALAGGFMIGEMATRASGMGSAFTAISDDASAAWHNPAGSAFARGNQFMIGGDVIITSGDYTSNSFTRGVGGVPITNTAKAKDGTFFVPHVYLTYQDEASKLGGTLSINSPFGLETEWPTTAAFSGKNTFSRLNMVMVNPSLVYKVNDQLSVAVGFDYAYMSKVNLDNTIQTLSGDGDGFGGNASIFYKGDSFNFGVNYRSNIKVDVKGTATANPLGPLAVAGSSAAATSVTLPDQLNVGMAFMPNEQWLLSFDADWVNWKKFKSIDITYTSALYRAVVSAVQAAIFAPVTGSTSLPQNWKATVDVRLGAEWKYNSQMRARFGYVFSPTPIKDADFSPSIPGNDRHIFSLGYSYDMNPDMTVDLGYAYVLINNRTQTQSPATPLGSPNSVKNGNYKGNAHILMASLNYHF